jgi:pimeloyl-ACP methyl ester carboxylesterase
MRKFFKRVGYTFFILLVLVMALPFFFSVTQQSLAADFKPFPESKFALIDDVRYHFREWNSSGSKGNILFVHGFSGSTFSWRRNIDTLIDADYRVLAIDLPPFGYSDRNTEINFSATANGLRIWKLLDSLDTRKWTVVGHSMGAGVVTAMAAMRPARTQSLILVDGVYFGEQGGSKLISFVANRSVTKRWAEVIGKHFFYNQKKFTDLLTSAYSAPADSLAAAGYLQPFLIKGTASGILSMVNSKEIVNLNLDKLTMPIQIIWGTNDTWVSSQSGQSFMKRFPDSEFIFIDGAGHCPMETHAPQFNVALLEFLNAN